MTTLLSRTESLGPQLKRILPYLNEISDNPLTN
jgi:hypothetical protein